MRYYLQIFTGGYHSLNYQTREILDRLSLIMDYIPVDSIIHGWSTDIQQNERINTFLDKRKVTSYFWMPALSELGALYPMVPARNAKGEVAAAFALKEQENFEFYCPSDLTNIENGVRFYDEYLSGSGFDGIFLDKIRSQSFIQGLVNGLSCSCSDCKEFYEDNGLDIEQFLQEAIASPSEKFRFTVQPDKAFDFHDSQTRSYLALKDELYWQSISYAMEKFKARGMKIGLDTFAPALAPIVGQDLSKYMNQATFIKPMLYGITQAPAGVQFECDHFTQATGNPRLDLYQDGISSFLTKEITQLRSYGSSEICPGMEINYEKDIVENNDEYIQETIETYKALGIEHVVLAWDIMQAPVAYFKLLKQLG